MSDHSEIEDESPKPLAESKSGDEGDDEQGDSDESSDCCNVEQQPQIAKLPHSQRSKAQNSTDSDDEDSELDKKVKSSLQEAAVDGWSWGSFINQATSAVSTISESVADKLSNVMEKVDQSLGIPDPEKLAKLHRKDEEKRREMGEVEVKTGIQAVLESVGLKYGKGQSSDEAEELNRLAEKVKGEKEIEETPKVHKSWMSDLSGITSKLMSTNVFETVSDVLKVDRGRDTIKEIAGRLQEPTYLDSAQPMVEEKPRKSKWHNEISECLLSFLSEFEKDDFPDTAPTDVHICDQTQQKIDGLKTSLGNDEVAIEVLLKNYGTVSDSVMADVVSLLSRDGGPTGEDLRDQLWNICWQMSQMARWTGSLMQTQFEKGEHMEGKSLSTMLNKLNLRESGFYESVRSAIECLIE